MNLLRRLLVPATALLAMVTVLAAPASAEPSEQDTSWMTAAHQSNLAEIAAGQAAQENATTETVRNLGAMFIEHHTALDEELTAVADELGVSLPDSPTEQQQAELDAVKAEEGENFDTAWIAQQIGAHQKSKAAGQQEIAQGQDPTVVGLAEAAAPVIQQHLDALLAAADAYGVPVEVPSGTSGTAAASTTLVGGVLLAAGVLALMASLVLVLRRRSGA